MNTATSRSQLASLYGNVYPPLPEELNLNVNVLLQGGVRVSLIDITSNKASEFALLSLDNISVSLMQTTQHYKAAATIQNVQLDFQNYDAVYPSVLFQRPHVCIQAYETCSYQSEFLHRIKLHNLGFLF